MPQRLYTFLVVLLLIFPGCIFGQQKHTNPAYLQAVPRFRYLLPQPGVKYQAPEKLKFKNFYYTSFFIADQPVPGHFSLAGAQPVNPAYYADCLGFFCRKELQLDKITAIPLRFRLGSLDYVNYMEQKPNVVKPGF